MVDQWKRVRGSRSMQAGIGLITGAGVPGAVPLVMGSAKITLSHALWLVQGRASGARGARAAAGISEDRNRSVARTCYPLPSHSAAVVAGQRRAVLRRQLR